MALCRLQAHGPPWAWASLDSTWYRVCRPVALPAMEGGLRAPLHLADPTASQSGAAPTRMSASPTSSAARARSATPASRPARGPSLRAEQRSVAQRAVGAPDDERPPAEAVEARADRSGREPAAALGRSWTASPWVAWARCRSEPAPKSEPVGAGRKGGPRGHQGGCPRATTGPRLRRPSADPAHAGAGRHGRTSVSLRPRASRPPALDGSSGFECAEIWRSKGFYR